ncbi:STAS domain-containing protein [Actinomadura nitritigenes]|uniref:STAS domain-containing protein n=1 Tax=Actinomadura nitritigenes TaxID=134602 RepID=UPI0036A1A9B7
MTASPSALPLGPRLRVDMAAAGPWIVIELFGELDLATVPALMEQAETAIAMTGAPWLALDLSQVSFCDSSGLNAFIRLWKHLRKVRGELALLRPHRRVFNLLERTGLDGVMQICDTLPA